MNEHSDELGQSDDALSENVRAFLARAQRCHQVPDPEVKQRVRAAIGVALIAAPLGAAPAALHELGAASKLAGRWSLGAKLGTAAVVATLAGSVGWLLPLARDSSAVRSTRSSSAPAASADTQSESKSKADPSGERAARAPVVTVAPSPTALLPRTEEAPNPTGPAAAVAAPQAGEERAPAGAEGVVDRSELSLLMAASDVLDTRDTERALVLLGEHRERFPDSALEQERGGLELVARCLRDDGQDARLHRDASSFLRRFPGAVLTTRIRRACGL